MASEAPRIGTDLIAPARVRRALEGREERWRRRVFTEAEWAQAQESADRDVTLAVCFAAKEAALKVLGTGWGSGIGWRDVELRIADDGGATLELQGRAAELATEAGLALTVSVASTPELAVAMVVGQPGGFDHPTMLDDTSQL